jgi:cytochrome c556
MRRFVSWAGVFAVIWAASVVVAGQAKPKLEDVTRVMRRAGSVQQLLVRAIQAADQATAKTQVAALKSGIVDSQPFWSTNKRTDAVEISKSVLTKIGTLENLVAAPKLDSAAALAAVQDMNRTCNDCHKIYRTTDEDGRYILKPGSVPGY